MAEFKRLHCFLCAGQACISAGAREVRERLLEELAEQGLSDDVVVVETGCAGACDHAPLLSVWPDETLYHRVRPEDVRPLVTEHFVKGRPYEPCMIVGEGGDVVATQRDFAFLNRQKKLVLENCGIIDPERIEEYIARDGYLAFGKALIEMTPGEVVDEVKASGLRGRGGAGFPTGIKWSFLQAAPGPQKYVICNADEGDPGAFMDRSVLEGDPHRVIEAMAIKGYATGANRGYIYCRAEYPLAIRRLQIALAQARDYGFLGEHLFETDFQFDIELRVGAGAFVCGEETALMQSIEGKRGQPLPRPPFPTQRGLWGCPTSINNVETYANIPWIVRHGGAEFAKLGVGRSTGTKVFALAGNVKNTGLVEVPMGSTLREVVFEIGGGVVDDRPFKAAQTGGPSGGCIPAEHLDTPMDYESLAALGAIIGSGGLIVLDDTTCMVDLARYYMEFCVDESCGKCIPCRAGTRQVLEILTSITEGTATMADLDRLEKLCLLMKEASLCGLGQTAPNPVLSTLRHFRSEYEAHILEHRCPAKVCGKLLTFTIDPEKCTGCGVCARNCPVDTIHRIDEQRCYEIRQDECIKCGMCFDVCNFGAVGKE